MFLNTVRFDILCYKCPSVSLLLVYCNNFIEVEKFRNDLVLLMYSVFALKYPDGVLCVMVAMTKFIVSFRLFVASVVQGVTTIACCHRELLLHFLGHPVDG